MIIIILCLIFTNPKTTPNTQLIVKTGMENLISNDFAPLQGKTIGLVTNHTAVDSKGTHLIDHLTKRPDILLKVVMAPEHGFKGVLDQENIQDSVDPKTGLRIHSLYGATRKPTHEMLEGIDLLLFDIQDIGVRFYTYQTTLLYAMEACSRQKIEIMVLDRPNPIGGTRFLGPPIDEDLFSFTGAFPLPILPGMTMGELASMFAGELFPQLKLTIIPCENWERSMTYEKTGLLWTSPSPNMRNLTQAFLYPAIGLLEYTNLSVGRGTDTPFECFGAPWVDPVAFVQKLNQRAIPGVFFVPYFFTPEQGPYKQERCGGIHIFLRDAQAFDPVDCSYTLFRLLCSEYPTQYQPENYLRLLANKRTFSMLKTQAPLSEIRKLEADYLAEFSTLRKKYLLYP